MAPALASKCGASMVAEERGCVEWRGVAAAAVRRGDATELGLARCGSGGGGDGGGGAARLGRCAGPCCGGVKAGVCVGCGAVGGGVDEEGRDVDGHRTVEVACSVRSDAGS